MGMVPELAMGVKAAHGCSMGMAMRVNAAPWECFRDHRSNSSHVTGCSPSALTASVHLFPTVTVAMALSVQGRKSRQRL